MTRRLIQSQMDDLLHIVWWWLQYDQLQAKDVAKWKAMDSFLHALLTEEQKAVVLKGLSNPKEFLNTLECTMATLKIGLEIRRVLSRSGREGNWRAALSGDPLRSPCPLNWSSCCRLKAINNGWLDTGCTPPPPKPPSSMWRSVNGYTMSSLLDSVSMVTMARPNVFPPTLKPGCIIVVMCIHGDAHSVPATKVKIPGKWPVLVGLIPDLPVPLLLGHDWPGYAAGINITTQRLEEAPRAAGVHGPQRTCQVSSHLLSSVFPQASQERCFGIEQKENDWLKRCSSQVLLVEGEKTDPLFPLPSAYFTVKNGLLYHHM
ncbi:uncharacterized protein LOC113641784 [Tachysurus fulvidraco]|uniref:uncharacterized protein LOC113641784 n=1 Tax=Tachysurus fulvidraco TaxID=1234273 RepID=UPI001FF0410E|nr:uncharacterized protein LOC113641784 [Tachysurus fulvidraco]